LRPTGAAMPDGDAFQPRARLARAAGRPFPDDRLLMSLYLRRSGVEILTASNGEEALQITAANYRNWWCST